MRVLPHGPDSPGTLFDLSECGCSIELDDSLPVEVGSQVEIGMIVSDLALVRSHAELLSDSANRMFVHGVKLRRMGILRRRDKDTRAAIQFIENGGPGEEQFHDQFMRLVSGTKEERVAQELDEELALRA
jgi:hypothetical protein